MLYVFQPAIDEKRYFFDVFPLLPSLESYHSTPFEIVLESYVMIVDIRLFCLDLDLKILRIFEI